MRELRFRRITQPCPGPSLRSSPQEYPHLPRRVAAYGTGARESAWRELLRISTSSPMSSSAGLLGYQIGRHIYKERHNPKLDDDLKIVAEQTSAPRPDQRGQRLCSPRQLDLSRNGAADRLRLHRYCLPRPAAVDAHVVRADAHRDEQEDRVSHRRSLR